MLTRQPLGRSGLSVAPLGLAGSFGIDAAATERAHGELGINYFFVTHRMKGLADGLREVVRRHRDDVVLASGATLPFGWSVRRAWEKEAKVLGVDRIDVFHIFWVQARWYTSGKSWTEMVRLKEEGKIGALAISCHDRPMARELVDELGLDVLMIRYNAAHRGAERDIFDHLDETDRPGICAYTATRWGRLLKPEGDLGPMTGPECYRFAAAHPKVDVVLCGARDYAELKADAEAIRNGPLPEPRLAEVKAFGDAVRATATGQVGFLGG